MPVSGSEVHDHVEKSEGAVHIGVAKILNAMCRGSYGFKKNFIFAEDIREKKCFKRTPQRVENRNYFRSF